MSSDNDIGQLADDLQRVLLLQGRLESRDHTTRPSISLNSLVVSFKSTL